jgi:hypothetical protein
MGVPVRGAVGGGAEGGGVGGGADEDMVGTLGRRCGEVEGVLGRRGNRGGARKYMRSGEGEDARRGGGGGLLKRRSEKYYQRLLRLRVRETPRTHHPNPSHPASNTISYIYFPPALYLSSFIPPLCISRISLSLHVYNIFSYRPEGPRNFH